MYRLLSGGTPRRDPIGNCLSSMVLVPRARGTWKAAAAVRPRSGCRSGGGAQGTSPPALSQKHAMAPGAASRGFGAGLCGRPCTGRGVVALGAGLPGTRRAPQGPQLIRFASVLAKRARRTRGPDRCCILEPVAIIF